MKPITSALARTLRALGVDRDIARADAVRAWREVATEAFGPDGATTRAIRAEGETLVVAVPGSHWSGEIRLREAELVRSLGARAPGADIVHIRTVPGADPRH